MVLKGVLWTNICSPVNKHKMYSVEASLHLYPECGSAPRQSKDVFWPRPLKNKIFEPTSSKCISCHISLSNSRVNIQFIFLVTHSSSRWAWLYITANIMQKLRMDTYSIYYLCRRFIFPKQCPFKCRVGFFYTTILQHVYFTHGWSKYQ